MAKMKVVQCWDDGVLNDLRLTELFRKYGAKATFNLNPGRMGKDTRQFSGWAKDPKNDDAGRYFFKGFAPGRLAQRDIPEIYAGFELASHCWNHETLGRPLTAREWFQTALAARHFLEDIVQKPCRGLAWPCGVYSQEACDLLRKAGFAYGRTCEYLDYVTDNTDPLHCATTCHYQDCGFFLKYEEAKKCGVFYFWGHSYEMLDCKGLWDQLEQKIRYISEDPDSEWADVIDIVPMMGKK